MAVAPWVLLPLVDARPASARSRAVRSAAAFGCIGGVNAVATGAALVLPTLWWLTRSPRREAWRGVLGWLGWCGVAGFWWLVPLLILGRYSPAFLDWIEDARVTTSTASPFTALQGTTAWVGFLTGADGPSWPAAYVMLTQPVLIVLTGVIAVVGLAGLSHPRMPQRSWLAASAVVGMVLLTMGFSGAGGGPLIDTVHGLLDGPLAPLRNTHKFEMVLRIPICLGLAHALSRIARWHAVRASRTDLLGAMAWLLVVAVAAPAVADSMVRPGGYRAIPEHWAQAARWLDAQPGPGTVLVLPSAGFAEFTWGSTRDEPLQALMRRPFVVRDAVPLGGAGSTRLLDEVNRRIDAGLGSAELARVLREAGIRFVLVRNDLLPGRSVTRAIPLHEALDESGAIRVATFGPPTGLLADAPGTTVDDRMLLPYPSVEVFDLGRVSDARFVPMDQVALGAAGPENLVDLAAAAPGARALVLGGDRRALPDAGVGLELIATDGLRRREVAFGSPGPATSEVLAAGDPGTTHRRSIDYVNDRTAAMTVATWRGVRSVTESSSASDAAATLRLGPGTGPAAVFDGDPLTRWVSGERGSAVAQWLEVAFTEPRDVDGVTVILSGGYPVVAVPTRLRVETDQGSVTTDVPAVDAPVTLSVPPGPTGRLRIRLDAVGPGEPNAFSVSELRVPGVEPSTELVLPPTDGQAPAVILARVEQPARTGCGYVGDRSMCSPALMRTGEETGGIRRSLTLPSDGSYQVSGTVLPAVGGGIERLLDLPDRITAVASSTRVQSPAGRPATVVDSDLGTGWVAGDGDARPRNLFGTETYVFEQRIDKQEIATRNLPAGVFDGTGADVATQVMYGNVRTLWVEPNTGVIVKGQEAVDKTLVSALGTVEATKGVIGFDEETIKKNAQEWGSLGSQLGFVKNTLPWLGPLAGVVLGALGLFLLFGGRRADRVAAQTRVMERVGA